MSFSPIKLSLACALILIVVMIVFRPPIGTKSSLSGHEDRVPEWLEIHRPYYPIPRELRMDGWGPLEGSYSFFEDPSYNGTEGSQLSSQNARFQRYTINGGFNQLNLPENVLVIEHSGNIFEVSFDEMDFGLLNNYGGLFPLGVHNSQIIVYVAAIIEGSQDGILTASGPPKDEAGQIVLNDGGSEWTDLISSLSFVSDVSIDQLCSTRNKSAIAFGAALSKRNCPE